MTEHKELSTELLLHIAQQIDVPMHGLVAVIGLLDEGGIDALRAVPERGRPAQLDEQQLAAADRRIQTVHLAISFREHTKTRSS